MKNVRHFNFIVVFIAFTLCFVGSSFAADVANSSDLVLFQNTKESSKASGAKKSSSETLRINVRNLQKYKIFTVSDPERLVVDVPLVAGKHSISLPANYHGKLIKSARFGAFDKQTSRFVFDLNTKITVVSEDVDDKKLIVEIAAQEADDINKKLPTKEYKSETILKTPSKNLAKNTLKNPNKSLDKNSDKIIAKATVKSQDKEIPKIDSKKMDAPPLIVIDAGHGGVDPGTIGQDGTQEKDVVLEYAKTLKAKLLKTGKYRVMLTREDDQFIMLRGRGAIARKAGASLFISIHADSADNDSARGLSVYTVSENASDKEAAALAARENKSDVIGGMDLSDERPDVADILISLAQRETKNNSAIFADLLVLSLGDRVRLLPNPHRFAGFAVLKAPDIPSVLIEVGFLSHIQEEKTLKSTAYREKVATGIISGIDSYFSKKSFANSKRNTDLAGEL